MNPLAENIQKILDDLVSNVRAINVRDHQPLKFKETSQDDYSFEPLGVEYSVAQHFQSTLESSVDVVDTDHKGSELKHFAGVRYYSSHLRKRALINRIHVEQPLENLASINFSLGARYLNSKLEQNPLTDRALIVKDWETMKLSTSRGHCIAKLKDDLGLGSLCYFF